MPASGGDRLLCVLMCLGLITEALWFGIKYKKSHSDTEINKAAWKLERSSAKSLGARIQGQ